MTDRRPDPALARPPRPWCHAGTLAEALVRAKKREARLAALADRAEPPALADRARTGRVTP